MMRLALLLATILALGWPAPALAKTTRVRWTEVAVRQGEDASRVARTLEKLLVRASRKAKWGKGDRLELTARVTKLSWQEHDDVLRVTVTVVARIEGGQIENGKSARSHIRIGGHLDERRALEKEALAIVANGLVTRLSDIARREGKSEGA